MAAKDKDRLGLKSINYILLVISTVIIGLGYLIMRLNDITVSPLLLTAVYVFLIPFALLYKTGSFKLEKYQAPDDSPAQDKPE